MEPHTCRKCGTSAPIAKFRTTRYHGRAYLTKICNRCYSVPARQRIQQRTAERLEPLLVLLAKHGPIMTKDLVQIDPMNTNSVGARLFQARRKGLVVSEPARCKCVRWNLAPALREKYTGMRGVKGPAVLDNDTWFAALQVEIAAKQAAKQAMRGRV